MFVVTPLRRSSTVNNVTVDVATGTETMRSVRASVAKDRYACRAMQLVDGDTVRRRVSI